jgi:hypothetical protein
MLDFEGKLRSAVADLLLNDARRPEKHTIQDRRHLAATGCNFVRTKAKEK